MWARVRGRVHEWSGVGQQPLVFGTPTPLLPLAFWARSLPPPPLPPVCFACAAVSVRPSGRVPCGPNGGPRGQRPGVGHSAPRRRGRPKPLRNLLRSVHTRHGEAGRAFVLSSFCPIHQLGKQLLPLPHQKPTDRLPAVFHPCFALRPPFTKTTVPPPPPPQPNINTLMDTHTLSCTWTHLHSHTQCTLAHTCTHNSHLYT